MNGRTRASRVATAGSRNVVLAVDTEILAPATTDFQASILAQRYGLTRAVANAVRDLAFPVRDDWRVRA